MDRLVALLNEYEAKDYEIKPGAVFWHLSGANEPLYAGWTAYASSFQIYSKEYGFIKWLVDNDKIDYEEYADEWRDSNVADNADFFNLSMRYNVYESLLMLLAIQDNPIEFLVSILR